MGQGNNPLRAISKHLKSKGLQKLRWYCQLCEKQCRDENGFKCHCASENHLRRVQLFGSNPKRVVDEYSIIFEHNFIKALQVSYRRVRVEATKVYNEVVAHKSHIHMNATKWTTLTEFVKHLGSRSDCAIEETTKGWFIIYSPGDTEDALLRQNERKRSRESTDDRLMQEVISCNSLFCNFSAELSGCSVAVESCEG
ncbi:domain of Kin17 curved DNA-binding protein-domain-containing protein [Ostreococcus tauri]|uniref:Domain of Kin17 curved DNA-binding protein-domain-containing protein n=1 Tax=Ostreococcus tauri TaxID=70448 RepID=A0A1Y5I042_OSTTA|nr:domain of Kin17 curved DNA-binding protein-domain-containing protein [Ostreococcus tauri]